jgi:hypothetical protein
MRFHDRGKTRHVVWAIALAGLLIAFQTDGYACFVITPEVPESFERARAVFIGEVIEIGRPRSSKPDAPLADRLYRVKFKVSYSWKGAGFREVGAPEIVVLSNQDLDTCFSWGSFIEGRKYLVYANETADKNLVVQLGTRTAPLANASEDLKKLERMSSPSFKFQFHQGPPGRNDSSHLLYQLLARRLNVSISQA